MNFFNQIVTIPTGHGTIIAKEDYQYKDVIIKKGFESDGASIPRIFWSIFPPFFPDYLTASMVHDYLCQEEQYAKADRYFDEILALSNVTNFTRVSLVTSVKTWHKIAYKKNNKSRFWLRLIKKIKG